MLVMPQSTLGLHVWGSHLHVTSIPWTSRRVTIRTILAAKALENMLADVSEQSFNVVLHQRHAKEETYC